MISRYIFPLVQSVQMDTVDTQSTVLIDLLDRVLDTCFLEALDLSS